MQRKDEKYLQTLGRMERPIPGQSLTNDPNNPLPFEGPPEFTKKKDALEYIFERMIDEEVYPALIRNTDSGVPIMDSTQMLLFSGFTQGKWNPDLMLLLMEPTAYMMMGLAERVGVDYRVDWEPDEEGVEEERVSKKSDELSRLKEKVGKKLEGKTYNEDALPPEIQDKIQSVPLPEAPLVERPGQGEPAEEEMAAMADEPEPMVQRPQPQEELVPRRG